MIDICLLDILYEKQKYSHGIVQSKKLDSISNGTKDFREKFFFMIKENGKWPSGSEFPPKLTRISCDFQNKDRSYKKVRLKKIKKIVDDSFTLLENEEIAVYILCILQIIVKIKNNPFFSDDNDESEKYTSDELYFDILYKLKAAFIKSINKTPENYYFLEEYTKYITPLIDSFDKDFSTWISFLTKNLFKLLENEIKKKFLINKMDSSYLINEVLKTITLREKIELFKKVKDTRRKIVLEHIKVNSNRSEINKEVISVVFIENSLANDLKYVIFNKFGNLIIETIKQQSQQYRDKVAKSILGIIDLETLKKLDQTSFSFIKEYLPNKIRSSLTREIKHNLEKIEDKAMTFPNYLDDIKTEIKDNQNSISSPTIKDLTNLIIGEIENIKNAFIDNVETILKKDNLSLNDRNYEFFLKNLLKDVKANLMSEVSDDLKRWIDILKKTGQNKIACIVSKLFYI